jgi:hypothetical protein
MRLDLLASRSLQVGYRKGVVRQRSCLHHPAIGLENEAREIRTPNLLIWSQTRCRCAIAP